MQSFSVSSRPVQAHRDKHDPEATSTPQRNGEVVTAIQYCPYPVPPLSSHVVSTVLYKIYLTVLAFLPSNMGISASACSTQPPRCRARNTLRWICSD